METKMAKGSKVAVTSFSKGKTADMGKKAMAGEKKIVTSTKKKC